MAQTCMVLPVRAPAFSISTIVHTVRGYRSTACRKELFEKLTWQPARNGKPLHPASVNSASELQKSKMGGGTSDLVRMNKMAMVPCAFRLFSILQALDPQT